MPMASGELQPAVLRFEVEPRFYQRLWFFPSVAALCAAFVVLLYRARIRRLRETFELVLSERNRIARELHDTLLQGLSGITMQLQALWTKLPPSHERQTLAEIIADAGKCSKEARRSLWGLRIWAPVRSDSGRSSMPLRGNPSVQSLLPSSCNCNPSR